MITGNTKRRRLAWLSVAFFTGAALLMPATMVLANTTDQTLPIASSTGVQMCGESPEGVAEGQVLWHFVQTQVDDAITTGELTATFTNHNGGLAVTVDSYKKSGGVLHFEIITADPDSLLSFSTNVESDGQLNLSHIYVCSGETTTTSSTSSTETTTTDETSSTETTTTDETSSTETTTTDETSSTETTTTDETSSTETTTTDETSSTETTTTDETSSTETTTTDETSSTETTTTDETSSTETTTGEVSGSTSTSSTSSTGNVSGTTSSVTLPETSMVEPTSPVNSGTISLAFLLMGLGSLVLLVLTPVQARKRD